MGLASGIGDKKGSQALFLHILDGGVVQAWGAAFTRDLIGLGAINPWLIRKDDRRCSRGRSDRHRPTGTVNLVSPSRSCAPMKRKTETRHGVG